MAVIVSCTLALAVALLAEGVDRNMATKATTEQGAASPSSRRAWIEILQHEHRFNFGRVALLAEGVDRNMVSIKKEIRAYKSPSSRRAWIEMFPSPPPPGTIWTVALLAEGVDRNVLHLESGCPDQVALLAEGVDRNTREELEKIPTSKVALLAEGVDRNEMDVDKVIGLERRPPRGGRG